MRLFVAVYPPSDVSAHLAGTVAGLAIGQPMPPGRSVRLVPQQQWHVTLAFIGEVPDARCPVAADAVAAGAAERAVAGPPVVRLGGGSRFGRSRLNPVCVDVLGDVEGLGSLAGAVRARLRRARVPFDSRPLRPHLTLARPGDRLPRSTIEADLSLLSAYEGPQWTVGEVRLVRSELGPRPVHTTVGAWRLDGATAT